jgi:hypothetical protein
MRRALPLLIFLVVAAPAQAQNVDRDTRASAEEALEQVEQIVDEPGSADPRALTPALVELARQKAELGTTDRRRARALLARPPDGDNPGAWTAPATAASDFINTTHFRVHWVDNATFNDAPDLTDADGNFIPDYVEEVAQRFEESWAKEVVDLGWQPPLSDGARGGDGRTDVYLSDLGRVYGYAVPETNNRNSYGYLVLDDEYEVADFPGYGGDPTIPIEATAAHEFNHILQFGYDDYQDTWMLESTATWAEDKVFDAANDYVGYLDSWALEPDEPITSPGDGTGESDLKMYGSAIWNHWIDRVFGEDVVRQAWAHSADPANTVDAGGFAPLAYGRVMGGGIPEFRSQLADFTAATAYWDAPNSGIHEGASFPSEVIRNGTMSADGAAVSGALDHTAFAFYDVPVPTGASQLNLTGGLPAGTAGALALIGYDGTNQDRTVVPLDADGNVTVTMADPGRFSSITAMVVNTDVSNGGFSNTTLDWIWTKDNRPYTLTATTGAVTVEPTPTPTPTVTPPPPPPPPPPATLGLTRSSTNLPFVARKGVLALFARVNKAGRLTAKATVDRATATRLKVGRRTTTAGTGRRTATAAARLKVNVTLTKKLRSALRKQTKRSVLVKVRVTFVPSDGTATVTKTILIRLKP